MDDLPEDPEWKERCEDGRRIWATRLESSAFGVIIVPASASEHYLPSPSGQFHVGIVRRDAQDGWTGSVIQEEWAETQDEALAVAAEYRERILTYAAEAILQ